MFAFRKSYAQKYARCAFANAMYQRHLCLRKPRNSVAFEQLIDHQMEAKATFWILLLLRISFVMGLFKIKRLMIGKTNLSIFFSRILTKGFLYCYKKSKLILLWRQVKTPQLKKSLSANHWKNDIKWIRLTLYWHHVLNLISFYVRERLTFLIRVSRPSINIVRA